MAGRLNKSNVWKFFDQKEDDAGIKTMTCTLCKKDFGHADCSIARNHIKLLHPEKITEITPIPIKRNADFTRPTTSKKQKIDYTEEIEKKFAILLAQPTVSMNFFAGKPFQSFLTLFDPKKFQV